MLTRLPSVFQFNSAKFWTAVAWLLISGWLVQSAQAEYGKVPIFFVENRGQIQAQAKYVAKASHLTGYFDANSVVFAADQGSFRLSFPGAAPAPRLEAMGPTAARINFLVGDPSQWRTNLPAWDAIAYRSIFPGVDLIYSSHREQLKSDFIVAPGADIQNIRLLYEGGAIHLDASGALIMPVGRGEFREEAPVLYQEDRRKANRSRGRFPASRRRDGRVSRRGL